MLTALAATAVHAQDRDDRLEGNKIRHVLLLSIDGMHAVDFLNCSKGLSTVNNGARLTVLAWRRWVRLE